MSTLRQQFILDYRGFRVDVPAGEHGIWAVRESFISPRDAKIQTIIGSVLKTERFSETGTYTQLVRYGALGNPYNVNVVMSDHPCEVADHEALVNYAKSQGRLKSVMIGGLGLGVAIELLAPYVDHFTIIELSSSVIKLVNPHYQNRYPGRIDIIACDVNDWQPTSDQHYDAIFWDIWDTISHENLPEMKRLHRRWGKYCDWQQSWARNYCERDWRKRQRHPEQYRDEVPMQDLYHAVNSLFS